MAIKVSGTTVVNDSRALQNITSVDSTSATAISTAVGSSMPAGAVIYVAMNSAPSGYLNADGTAVSRTTYADLFSAIGTTYGSGDGSSTFNVPDLRAEFIRGFDAGRDVDSGRVFGSSQDDAYEDHTHSFATFQATTNTINSGVGTGTGVQRETRSSSGGSVGSGTETRPRNVAMLACIKT